MKARWLFLFLAIVLLLAAFDNRRMLVFRALALTEETGVPDLLDAADEGPQVRWLDDYFTIQTIAENTIAIGEPRYLQVNFSYLLIGEEQALLFDAGPGLRDIRAVAEGLTDRPILFLPSHLHYDHVGNDITFDRIALIDVPATRPRADGNLFSPSDYQYLGMMEDRETPTWEIDQWIEPGETIDLGGRSVQVLFTPGHTDDSVSIYDAGSNLFFSGDYLYPGPLYGFLPNSSMSDYLATTEPLLDALPRNIAIYGAHRDLPPGAPVLAYDDLADLRDALLKLREGELEGAGTWPMEYPINDRLYLLAEPRWLQDW